MAPPAPSGGWLSARPLTLLALVLWHILGPRGAPPPAGAARARAPQCAARGAALAAAGDLHGAARRARAAAPRAVAAAVVTHAPTFALAAGFVAAKVAARACDWDVFLVFSNAAEAAAFAAAHGAPAACAYAPLVLAWPCHAEAALASARVIITAKKLFALAVLGACYDVVLPLDAEMRLLAPRRVRAAALGAAARRRVLGGRNAGHEDCSLASAAPLPRDLAARAANATDGWAVWTWWTELPVVEGADVPAFADAIDFPARAPQAYEEFEHLTYTFWKAARGEWAVVDLSASPAAPRDGPVQNVVDGATLAALAARFPPAPAWLTAAACAAAPERCDGTGAAVIAHHVDRGAEPWWGSKWAPGSPLPDGGAADDPHEAEEAICPRARFTNLTTGV